MDQMVTANPQSAQAYLLRARYHRRLHELAEAARDLKRARELDPANVEALLSAAQLAVDQEDREQARLLLKAGLQQHPDNEAIYQRLAWLEREAGRRDQAI